MSLEQRCPSSARDCHGNYRSDGHGCKLYENAERPILAASGHGLMTDQEWGEYRRAIYRERLQKGEQAQAEYHEWRESWRRVAAISDGEVLRDIEEINRWVDRQEQRSAWQLDRILSARG